jgi:2-polyprenyl-6-hydroxyphenyl methylase/3-demethylubiquinone-9 3-methyltransferase
MFQSEKQWDQEWSSGAWDYMEKVIVERSKNSIVGGVFSMMYIPNNGSVLDIGCGEGALSDFLTINQKANYVGVDLSKEAIIFAKAKRKPPLRFVHSAAHEFVPKHKFDMIVLSDVLYYVEYEKVIKQYAEYLNPNGVIVISIFQLEEASTKKLGGYENIFNFARSYFTYVDEVDVAGFTKKKLVREKTSFHIEVYRLKIS